MTMEATSEGAPATSSAGPATRKKTNSCLQSNPKYARKAALKMKAALMNADKRDDGQSAVGSLWTTSSTIPDLYVDTIVHGFGADVDLYRDVLQVAPDASPREIRISYFRRGREVLAESGIAGLDQAATDDDAVTGIVRTRFQAVSMAYEIISTPAWNDFYMENGLAPMDAVSVGSNDAVPDSIDAAKPAVRWSEQVEELVFDREPGEITVPTQKTRKSRKPRVMVEATEELDEHLRKLDEEAEQHFVVDFWDSLEESLDGLLKLSGDDMKNKKPKTKRKKKKTDDSSVASAASDDTPFDEPPEEPEVDASQNLWGKRPPMPTHEHKADNLQETIPGKATGASSRNPKASFHPIAATSSNDNTVGGDSDLFDLESIDFSKDGKTNSDEGSDVEFPTIEVGRGQSKSEGQVRSGSPTNMSVVSDLSGSMATFQSQRSKKSISTSSKLSNKESSIMASQESSSVKSGENDTIVLAARAKKDADLIDQCCETTVDFVDSLAGPSNPQSETSAPERSPETSDQGAMTTTTASEGDGFLEYFIAYVQAIVNECGEMGKQVAEADWAGVASAFLVDDNDMDEVRSIVSQEVQKAPPLQVADAVSPTSVALDTARSFG